MEIVEFLGGERVSIARAERERELGIGRRERKRERVWWGLVIVKFWRRERGGAKSEVEVLFPFEGDRRTPKIEDFYF